MSGSTTGTATTTTTTLTLDERIALYEAALDTLATGTPVTQVTEGSMSHTFTSPKQIQDVLNNLYSIKASRSGHARHRARFRF